MSRTKPAVRRIFFELLVNNISMLVLWLVFENDTQVGDGDFVESIFQSVEEVGTWRSWGMEEGQKSRSGEHCLTSSSLSPAYILDKQRHRHICNVRSLFIVMLNRFLERVTFLYERPQTLQKCQLFLYFELSVAEREHWFSGVIRV